MNYGELLAIAIALAVDAATYAFSYGLALRQGRARAALELALVVGVFQAGMPLLGHLGGVGLRSAVESWGSWLGLLIFVALGGSVLYKTWLSKGEESAGAPTQALGVWGLLLVGLATSMDAFAVGICLAVGKGLAEGAQLSSAQLGLAVSIIGLVTFLAALVCFRLSSLLHHLPERWLQTLAGILLIALGIYQL